MAIRIAELEDSSLIARPIAPVRTVLTASPGYLAEHGVPRTPQALVSHRCLLYTNLPEPGVWRYRDPREQPGEVRVSPVLRANNGDFLRQAAVDGQGIALQPLFICYQAIERGELEVLLGEYRWHGVNAYAVYPQTRHLSQRVRAFVDFLVARFAGVPYWEKCLQQH